MPARVLSSKQRLALLELVFKEGIPVAKACQEFGVSRFTFYKWAKRYDPDKPHSLNLENLQDKKRRIKEFVRQAPREIEERVRAISTENPTWSKYKIWQKLKDEGKVIGVHGVYNILRRAGLQTPARREEYRKLVLRLGKRVLTPEQRLEVLKRAVQAGVPVAQVCRDFGISRFTFYKWKKRWERVGRRTDALVDKKRQIDRFPGQVSPEYEQIVLSLVIEAPDLSKYKLARKLQEKFGPILGVHGVYNVLRRHGLNLPESRFAFAQVHAPAVAVPVSWIDRVRLVWEEFITGLAPAPPWLVDQLRRASPPFLFSLVATSVFSLSALWWINLLSSQPVPVRLGLVFATVALTIGSFFFAYSMKYYFTLAIVLSFSQQAGGIVNSPPAGGLNGKNGNGSAMQKGGFLSWILGLGNGSVKSRLGGITPQGPVGLEPSLEHVVLKRHPFVSVHIPLYNEPKVVERILTAVTAFDWAHYEVIVVDDSTDETTGIALQFLKVNYGELRIIKDDEGTEIYKTPIINPNDPSSTLKNLPTITLIHRTSRSGFKGGALREALRVSDPKAEFMVVFDADFVPYPDTIQLFLKYFKVNNNMSEDYRKSNLACVQGYQWHVLNKSENWITRGVRGEYSGSYVVERSGAEILGALKMIAGSVYMVRRDLLERFGWGTSITEDFQLTLRLYEAGYKVVYTPYIQAPAECVSTIQRLVRQRMRWAEGHSHNIRRMFVRLLFGDWKTDDGGQKTETEDRKQMTENQSSRSQSSRTWVPSPLTLIEKLEFLYLSPYYLQAFFFLVGTISWLLAETIFPARLPFWTSLWGWSLVLTNFLALPLMNAVGLFLEEGEEKDYQGIISFVILSYILVPFQAYAAIKGFLEREEGPWFRTPKTGKITDIFTRGKFYRFISGILPGRTPAIGAKSLAASLQPLTSNPYLGLATANNQFDSFRIRPKRMRWYGKLALVFVLTVSLFIHSLAFRAEPVEATWYNSSWQFRKTITIDNTKVTADLTDFPVLINFASDTDLAADAQDDGDDILFTSSDKVTKLSHEIEKFDGTTGELVAWVKVPSVADTTDTILYIYYGNATATNQQNTTGVWDVNYKAAWHLREIGNGTLDEFKDSTSNANHGRGGNGVASATPTRVAGKIGYGQSFDGGDDIVDTAAVGLPNCNAAQSMSVWYKVTTNPFALTNFLVLRNSGATRANQTMLGIGAGNDRIGATQWGGGITVDAAQPAQNAWHYLVWTWDGTTNRLYVDGAQVATSTTALQVGTIDQALFSTYDPTTPSETLTGIMDEVRTSSGARSAGWIATDYNNQNSPSTFYSLGTEEEIPEFLALLLPVAVLAPAVVKYFLGRRKEWAAEVVKN